jgi:hypothetical protein
MVMQYRIEDKDNYILDTDFRSRFVFMQDVYTRNNPGVEWTGDDEQFEIVLKMINDAMKLFEPEDEELSDYERQKEELNNFKPIYDMDGNLLRI